MSSGYYPPGAENDQNAPYNEKSNPEKEFNLLVTTVMTKSITIVTDDYELEIDEDEGGKYEYVDTKNTDWDQAFYEQDYSVQYLLHILSLIAYEQLENKTSKLKLNWKEIYDTATSWEVERTDYEEI